MRIRVHVCVCERVCVCACVCVCAHASAVSMDCVLERLCVPLTAAASAVLARANGRTSELCWWKVSGKRSGPSL